MQPESHAFSALDADSSWLAQARDRDLIQELLADKRSENTRRAYQKDLEDFFLVISKSAPTPSLVQQFLSLDRFQALSLLMKYKSHLIGDRALKEASVNRKLAAVKSLVNFARKLGKCTYSLDDVKGEKVKPYRDTSGVNVEAYKRVLEGCDRTTTKGKRDYAILHLLWSNALRRNEVATLNIGHFDPDGRCLQILGKGRGMSREFVSLSDRTLEAIMEWLATREILSDSEAPLFTSLSNHQYGHRLTGEALWYLVDRYSKKAGISKQMSPHRIRHSSITHALDETGDVRKVQRLSRHAKIETLLVYDDNRSDIQGEVSQVLADALDA